MIFMRQPIRPMGAGRAPGPGNARFQGLQAGAEGGLLLALATETSNDPEDYSMKRTCSFVLATTALLALLGAPRHAWAQG